MELTVAEVKKRGRRSIDPAKKEQALKLLGEGAMTAKDIAEKIGVSYPTIMNWKSGAVAQGKAGRAADSDMELLRLENEYLKKKLAYYERINK
jgi:transposase-like protein